MDDVIISLSSGRIKGRGGNNGVYKEEEEEEMMSCGSQWKEKC